MGDALGAVGGLIGGNPSGSDINKQADKLVGPDKANYQIGGADAFRSNTGANSRVAYDQAANYNQQLADSNRKFQGMGQAGAAQQDTAFNLMNQMAQGKGPSLAAANMQAGLNQQNLAAQSQAMSSAGNTGLGNSQRNLLNAQ